MATAGRPCPSTHQVLSPRRNHSPLVASENRGLQPSNASTDTAARRRFFRLALGVRAAETARPDAQACMSAISAIGRTRLVVGYEKRIIEATDGRLNLCARKDRSRQSRLLEAWSRIPNAGWYPPPSPAAGLGVRRPPEHSDKKAAVASWGGVEATAERGIRCAGGRAKRMPPEVSRAKDCYHGVPTESRTAAPPIGPTVR